MPTQRKIHRTEQDWQQIIQAYEDSGLTQNQFCQQHHLAFSTFTKWKNQLSAGSLSAHHFMAIEAEPIDELPKHSPRFEMCLTWLNKLHCTVKFG